VSAFIGLNLWINLQSKHGFNFAVSARFGLQIIVLWLSELDYSRRSDVINLAIISNFTEVVMCCYSEILCNFTEIFCSVILNLQYIFQQSWLVNQHRLCQQFFSMKISTHPRQHVNVLFSITVSKIIYVFSCRISPDGCASKYSY